MVDAATAINRQDTLATIFRRCALPQNSAWSDYPQNAECSLWRGGGGGRGRLSRSEREKINAIAARLHGVSGFKSTKGWTYDDSIGCQVCLFFIPKKQTVYDTKISVIKIEESPSNSPRYPAGATPF